MLRVYRGGQRTDPGFSVGDPATLLDRLTRMRGLTPEERWRHRDDGETGELDRCAERFGLKRGGYWPSSESMHGSQERFDAWLAHREPDERLRDRLALVIQTTLRGKDHG